MQNERGFFTIIGLCLLLVAAISIKGVHEFEANYSHGVFISRAEHELQNAADSALIETKAKLQKNLEIDGNYTLHSDFLNEITIQINYATNYQIIAATDGNAKITLPENKPATVIISVASCDNPFIEGKIYRRSLAYIDDATQTLHFMSD